MKVLRIVNLLSVAAIIIFVLLPYCVVSGTNESKPSYDVFGVGMRANSLLAKYSDYRKNKVREFLWKYKGMSPTPSLVIGKDGWIYISDVYNNNEKIARGTYPYPQDVIDRQMTVFSNLKEHYNELGSDLYVLPFPANMSVYPEVVPDGNYTVGVSPCDILSDNLKRRTNVNVINPKWQMINYKSIGQIFCKRDSHATDLGIYAAYKEIRREIEANSGIKLFSYDEISFIDGDYILGINDIAGIPGFFGETQTAPVAVCDLTAKLIKSGDFYDTISSTIENNENQDFYSTFTIYENPDAPNGTLLIYGTSNFVFDNIGEENQLTKFLAQNFKRTVFIWYFGKLSSEIDSIIAPDVTILEIPERYMNLWHT